MYLPAEAALQALQQAGNTATGRWLVMLSGSGYAIAMANFGGDGDDPVGFGPEQRD